MSVKRWPRCAAAYPAQEAKPSFEALLERVKKGEPALIDVVTQPR